MIRIFSTIAMFLSLSAHGHAAYLMPVGIPDPATQWGGVQDPINDVAPERPTIWASEIAGYYYINDDTGQETACSNTRTYGYPGYARCAVPQIIPAGSRVEIGGNYNTGNYSANFYIIANGTSAAFNPGVTGPVWVVGSDGASITKMPYIFASEFLYLDSVHVSLTGSGSVQIGSASTEAYGQNTNIAVRNSEINGDGLAGGLTHGVIVQGFSDTVKPVNVLVYNSLLHDHSYPTWYADNDFGDQDAHVIIVNQYTDNLWILSNEIYNASGSGIAIGQDAYSGENRIDNAYVGKNHVHHTLQSGMATKGSRLVIFSENNIHNQHTRFESDWTPASYGKCIGYGDNTSGPLYYLNNVCHDSYFGVHGGGTNQSPVFVISGNLFYNIYSWEGLMQQAGGGAWEQGSSAYDSVSIAALYLKGAYIASIINNSFYNIEGVVYQDSATAAALNFQNNIVSGLRSTNSMFFNFSGDSTLFTDSVIDNNILHSSGNTYAARSGGGYYNTVADIASNTNDCGDCTTGDPVFVAAGSNFKLQASSPARDAGAVSAVYADFMTTYGLPISKDISGTARPQNGLWDIGAYEYTDGAIRARGFRVSAE